MVPEDDEKRIHRGDTRIGQARRMITSIIVSYFVVALIIPEIVALLSNAVLLQVAQLKS